MIIRRLFKRLSVRIATAVYLVLWIITAVVGNSQIDRAFDAQFRYGYPKMGSDERVEITRIEKFYVRDLEDPRNESLIPENGLFRYRGSGIAIAPFIVVDEVGIIFASQGGGGAIRLNLWFFGENKAWVVYSYWHV